MVYQVTWCKKLVTYEVGSYFMFPIQTLVINSIFLLYLLFKLRSHLTQFTIRKTKIIKIFYFSIYLIAVLDITVSILSSLETEKNRSIPLLSSLCSSFIFFCEVSLLLFMIFGNSLSMHDAIKKTLSFSILVSFIYLAVQLVYFFMKEHLFVFQYDSKSALLFWVVVDTAFVIIYLALIIMANMNKFRYKLPMKQNFFSYLFFMFATKLIFLTGLLFLILNTYLGYW
ncbi:transmembrane protein adipocyte-associated [Anaeramoeba flamelloides]|uniref:Transmembrane protein adipocyte-associated n=1 Tax=Anaeramoeba flamelloides TaxID=1746091 RepID=A0AAV7ZWS3_9EUKA|nr:transmembrane protein adipocyte-associated [Anaeramoeba flamelloides]